MSIDFPSEDSPLNTPTNTVVVEFIRCCTVLWKGYKLKLLPVPSYAVDIHCTIYIDKTSIFSRVIYMYTYTYTYTIFNHICMLDPFCGDRYTENHCTNVYLEKANWQ